jgi:hypothetical protein
MGRGVQCPEGFSLAFTVRQGTVKAGISAGHSGAGMSITRPGWLNWKGASVAAVLLLTMVAACYFYANPGLDPVQAPEIERILHHLRVTPINGWKATAARDVITVRRNEPVAVFSDISLRSGLTREELKAYTRSRKLEITIKVCSRVQPEEYEQRVEVNRETEAAIQEFRRTKLGRVPRTKPNEDNDPWSHYHPETRGDRALITEFKSFIRSLPNYDMPNYYSEEHSYYVSSSVKVIYYLYDLDEEAEYLAAWNSITSLFKPHSNAQPPLQYWTYGDR